MNLALAGAVIGGLIVSTSFALFRRKFRDACDVLLIDDIPCSLSPPRSDASRGARAKRTCRPDLLPMRKSLFAMLAAVGAISAAQPAQPVQGAQPVQAPPNGQSGQPVQGAAPPQTEQPVQSASDGDLPVANAQALTAKSIPLPSTNETGFEANAERLTLQQALDRALSRNVTVQVADQEVRRAQALMEQARAPSLPTLVGNGSYTRLDGARTLPNGPVIAGQDQVNGTLTVSVPLIAPPRWAAWARASDFSATAKLSDADVRRTIATSTARSFLTVISQRRQVDLNGRAVTTAQAHLDFARERRRGGVGTRLDEVRAEQELRTTEGQLFSAQTALTRAREALAVLVGSENPVDAAEDPGLALTPSFDEAIKDAANRRADVRLSQERLKAAQRSSALGWTDYLPLVNAVFAPFYQNPPSLVQPLTGWQAQLLLTIPFYDGGLRYGQQHEREALETEAKAQVDSALRQVRSELRGSFEAVRQADQALTAAQRAAKLAHEALDLATLAYRAGASTNLEVIDAERRAHDADSAAALAEDGARQARLDLLVAAGRFP